MNDEKEISKFISKTTASSTKKIILKTKKDLKNQYKEMKFPMGVFQIRNKKDGKILIDSSLNMPAKWNRHHVQLKFGSHRNKRLQEEWNQFGTDNFVYEIISEIEYKNEQVDYSKEIEVLLELYLEELQPYGEKGYNKIRKLNIHS